MGRRFRRCLAVHDAIKRCLAAGGEVLKRLDFNFHELAHESRTVSVAEGNVLQAQQTIGNGPVVAAVTELVLPLQPLESRLTGTKDRVEKHLLKLRVFHKVGKVAVRRAFDLDPIVLRKLDDFAPPEGDFILVDLLPKVAAPQEIVLVNVEIVSVGEAAQQRWRQRGVTRDALNGRRRLACPDRFAVVLPPLCQHGVSFRIDCSVDHLSGALVVSVERTPDLFWPPLGLQGLRHWPLVIEVLRPFRRAKKGYLGTSTIPRIVAANGSSRVSETLAEQGLLADQWLMGEMAPRRGVEPLFPT